MEIVADTNIQKQHLLGCLLDAVKQVQVRFGGKTELATETDSRVSCLCATWEAVLQHGMKHTNKALSTLKQVTEMTGLIKVKSNIGLLEDIYKMETEPAYWHYIKEHLNTHELERYKMLKNVNTDAGKGRAWLRSALNEHSIEKYMHMIIENFNLISQYYENWAFLMDQEKSSMLPNMAAGLDSILFAISIDNGDFNTIRPANGLNTLLSSTRLQSYKQTTGDEQQPVIMGDSSISIPTEKSKQKRKKKRCVNIISFDNDDLEYGSCTSTPISTPLFIQKDNYANSLPVGALKSTCTETSKDAKNQNMGLLVSGNSSLKTAKDSTPASDIGRSPCDKVNGRQTDENTTQSFNWPPTTITAKNNQDEVKPDNKIISKSIAIPTPCKIIPLRSEAAGSSLQNSLVEEVPLDKVMKHNLSDAHNVTSPVAKPLSVMDNDRESRYLDLPLTTQTVSPGFLDESHSQTSLTSLEDVTIRKSGSGTVLTPLSPEGPLDDIQILCSSLQSMNEEDSILPDSVPSYSDDTENATFALSIAQKGISSRFGLRTDGDGIDAPDPVVSKSQDMSSGELREAIVALMVRKEEIEKRNISLQDLLNQQREYCDSLRLELKINEQQLHETQGKNQDKMKSLARENELLKHQLKKYVGAVQMLRQNSSSPDLELPGIHLDSVQPSIPPSKFLIDYSHEASEFEKKLIQVAEMHGELMEFNEYLHKQLNVKDNQLKRLQSELVELRGPLPPELQLPDDNTSIYSEMDTTPSGHPLIHFWIPSAFLKGTSSDAFHVYQIYVRIKDEEWNIYRRYTDFYDLHKKLKKEYPLLSSLQFPPKKTLGNRQEKFVECRRKLLQDYIRQMMNIVIAQNPVLSAGSNKASLIQQMPFFGNICSKKKNKRSQNTSSQAQTHQYMGL